MGDRVNESVVPTPLGRRLLWWRRKFVPLAVWCLAVVLIAVLVQRNPFSVDATGIVQLREVPVAPVEPGRVQGVAVGLFDTVKAGQVVALMDDTVVRSELMGAEAELTRLRAQVDAERERFRMEAAAVKRDTLNDARRFALDEQEARLDHLDRLVQQEVDTVSLQWMESIMQRQEAMAKQHVVDQTAYDETRLRYEALKKQVAEGKATVAAAEQRLNNAIQLRKEASGVDAPEPSEEQVLAPLRDAVEVQHAVIETLHARRQMLAMAAPVDGHVARILVEPGATALAGQPVLTITASGGGEVVAYLDEKSARDVAPGTPVRVVSRRQPSRTATAEVLKVSPQIELLPPHLQGNPAYQQWGLPLLIGKLPDGFLPGEVVHVTFLPNRVVK